MPKYFKIELHEARFKTTITKKGKTIWQTRIQLKPISSHYSIFVKIGIIYDHIYSIPLSRVRTVDRLFRQMGTKWETMPKREHIVTSNYTN